MSNDSALKEGPLAMGLGVESGFLPGSFSACLGFADERDLGALGGGALVASIAEDGALDSGCCTKLEPAVKQGDVKMGLVGVEIFREPSRVDPLFRISSNLRVWAEEARALRA